MDDVTSLEKRLGGMFEKRMNLAVPSVDTDLFDTGGLDSLTFVELLLHLDRDFGVRVTLDDLELDNFRSIGRIARFIAGHQEPRRACAVRPLGRE